MRLVLQAGSSRCHLGGSLGSSSGLGGSTGGSLRGGALRDEFTYFTNCALKGEVPTIGRPDDAVAARPLNGSALPGLRRLRLAGWLRS